MAKLSKRDKRTLWLGGIAGAVILFLVYGIMPLSEANANLDSELGEKAGLLQRSIKAVENEDIYRSQLATLESMLDQYRGQLLDSNDGNVARVQLEEIVRGLAESNGVTISRSNPLQETKIGDKYARVRIQINLTGDMPELTSFIYDLSNHPKFIVIDEFFMNGFRLRDEIRLQPRLNISGYIRLSPEETHLEG